jgi:hypothetical protein
MATLYPRHLLAITMEDKISPIICRQSSGWLICTDCHLKIPALHQLALFKRHDSTTYDNEFMKSNVYWIRLERAATFCPKILMFPFFIFHFPLPLFLLRSRVAAFEKIDQQTANPYKRIVTDDFPLYSSSPPLSNASDLPQHKAQACTCTAYPVRHERI